jgi:hypothetical protein
MRCWVLAAFLFVACGGKGAAGGGEKKVDLDADPLALFPASAVVVANANARALPGRQARSIRRGRRLPGVA